MCKLMFNFGAFMFFRTRLFFGYNFIYSFQEKVAELIWLSPFMMSFNYTLCSRKIVMSYWGGGGGGDKWRRWWTNQYGSKKFFLLKFEIEICNIVEKNCEANVFLVYLVGW